MSTPHNQAAMGEIAEKVLLPGDPLRAKFIAENFLKDVVRFNATRNMFGYTGTYNGERVSVMGTGMGLPSIGIYAYELIHEYGVKKLIRVGSAGAFSDKLRVYDVVLAQGACTDSNFAYQYDLKGTFSAISSWELLKGAHDAAEKLGIPVHVGNVFSTDIFYNQLYQTQDHWKKWAGMGVLCVDMESYGLYAVAAQAGVDALTILTISDSLVTGELTTAEEREKSFDRMMRIALEV